MIAEWMRDACALDDVLFIPSGTPPHKDREQLSDRNHRRAMVDLAIRFHDRFSLCDIEIASDAVSYTVDTLQTLRDQLGPEAECVLMLGEDSLRELPTWRNPEEILRLARVVVARRAGAAQEPLPLDSSAAVKICETPEIAISSTMIRQKIREGRSIRYLVPEAVEQYIRDHQLYATASIPA